MASKKYRYAHWSGFGMVKIVGEAESPLRGKYYNVRSAVPGFPFGTKPAYAHELRFVEFEPKKRRRK